MPASGAAVLATWYDLPPENATAYLDWLHGSYLPGLLERPGYLWAAHYRTLSDEALAEADGETDILSHTRQMGIPPEEAPELGRGSRYLTMVGANDA